MSTVEKAIVRLTKQQLRHVVERAVVELGTDETLNIVNDVINKFMDDDNIE